MCTLCKFFPTDFQVLLILLHLLLHEVTDGHVSTAAASSTVSAGASTLLNQSDGLLSEFLVAWIGLSENSIEYFLASDVKANAVFMAELQDVAAASASTSLVGQSTWNCRNVP